MRAQQKASAPKRTTQRGAVYWYFVPVMWFWKPFEAMGNLWRGFKVPDNAGTWLGLWWLLWCGGFAKS
ncbi:DUF4328 domain-containing protein [Mesorhizobium sp. B2-3-13]|nr:DUF4328 domain-containing protein [Mesorhizobium sp. B2-3-13]